ncbi:phosphate-starvation-inducible PsiE family protein [Calidithermus roseus]|uniref:Phosphate-starvation-inducible E n=1 Tax=Calidithermus roseus TaxID=1644118 RepID=A0A399EVB8_9DEIN|nr:phosphate-starvation-inducible PsiE family protein [Calidithermus roseus]RIH87988.1 Phosphate-starvation-inducible E [Calidithermus roseus]
MQKGLQQSVLRGFRFTIQLIFNLAILALLLGLLIGVGRTLLELGLTLSEPSVRLGLKDLVTNVLSLVVMLELVRAFVEYFEYERIRLEVLLEVGVAFVLREMLLGLFGGDIQGMEVLLWSSGLLALVAARALAAQCLGRGKDAR